MSVLLHSQLTASVAATTPHAHRRLASEARVTLHALEAAASLLASAGESYAARRLRTRAEHLRDAIEASEG